MYDRLDEASSVNDRERGDPYMWLSQAGLALRPAKWYLRRLHAVDSTAIGSWELRAAGFSAAAWNITGTDAAAL